MRSSTDVAFTASVKAAQERHGSREAYRRLEAKGGFATGVTPELAEFLARVRSFYFATASADGQPYVQHRGGPPGFLRVVDERTLGFADFAGNRQYLSVGNLAENPHAFIFLMDYASRRRIKIWGRAHVIEEDAELLHRLFPAGYRARPEQAILFSIEAWDQNCPQHIPHLVPVEDVDHRVRELAARIGALENENARLRERQFTPSAAENF